MKDQATELFLEGQGVPWTYDDVVPIEDIDQRAGILNNARLSGKLNQLMVEELIVAQRNGANFPAIILLNRKTHPANKPALRPLGGNHRLAALIAEGCEWVDAYIVQTTDDYVIDRITRSDNQRNGDRPPREHTIEQALYMIDKYNKPMAVVARDFGLPESTLNSAVRTRNASLRLESLGIKPTTTSKIAANQLGNIQSNKVLQRAATLVTRAQLTAPETSDLVKQINQRAETDEQLAIVHDWESRETTKARIAEARGGRSATRSHLGTTRVQLYGAISRLETLIKKHPTFSALQVTTPAEVKRICDDIERIAQRLRRARKVWDEERDHGTNEGHSRLTG